MTSDEDEAPLIDAPPQQHPAFTQPHDAAADVTEAAVGGGEVAGRVDGLTRQSSMPPPPPPRVSSSSSVGSTKSQPKRANNSKRDGAGGFRFAGKAMDPNSLL